MVLSGLIGRPSSDRPQHDGEEEHRPDQRHRHPLGLVHRQALGQQIGQHDEQDGDAGEGQREGHALRRVHVDQRSQQRLEMRRQRALPDHAGQDRQRVDADLHDGEVVARLLLDLQHLRGAVIAFVRQLSQLQPTRRGQRELRHREERAGADQQEDEQQAGTQGGFRNLESRQCSGRPLWGTSPFQAGTAPAAHLGRSVDSQG
jgi:hypothetical protein